MNDDDALALERLAHGLDAYGGDLDRWPAPLRGAAEALIAREPEARRLHDAARALDRLLDQAPMPSPSRRLRARVLERAAPPVWRQSLGALWPFGPAWQPAAALALIAALGIVLGPYIGSDDLNASTAGEIDGLALGGSLDEGDLP